MILHTIHGAGKLRASPLAQFSLFVLLCLAMLSNAWAEDPAVVKAGDLPLQEFSLVEGQLPVAFKIKLRCSFGDMNALVLDSMAADVEEEVLLTLESLQGAQKLTDENRYVLSTDTAMQEARSDLHAVSLRLPEPLKDGLYGIFVCRASPGASRLCQDKEPAHIQRILNEYIEDAGQPRLDLLNKQYEKLSQKKVAGVKDRFYFFKPLVFSEGKVYFLNETMSDSLYQKFKTHFSAMKLADDDVTRVQEYDKTLGNIPLRDQNGRLVVTMPVFDNASCDEQR